jgi:ferrous iron transport protein B
MSAAAREGLTASASSLNRHVTPRTMNAAAAAVGNDLSPAVLLVGHPNVGKSVLFHRLTGAYVNVSNYPGTTVEVSRASAALRSGTRTCSTRRACWPCPRAVTTSASPCARCSTRTARAGPGRRRQEPAPHPHPDRAAGRARRADGAGAQHARRSRRARRGAIDMEALAEALGIPVVATVATGGKGIGALTAPGRRAAAAPLLHYDKDIEATSNTSTAAIDAALPHPRLGRARPGHPLSRPRPEVAAWLRARPASWAPTVGDEPQRARAAPPAATCPPCWRASAAEAADARRRCLSRSPRSHAAAQRSASASAVVHPCGACPSCWPCST